MRWASFVGALVGGLTVGLSMASCSTDPAESNETEAHDGADEGACIDGSAGCACYGNDTCRTR